MAGPTRDPLTEALETLNRLIQDLPSTLSSLFGFQPIQKAQRQPPDPWAALGNASRQIGFATQPWIASLRSLSPAMGRFAGGLFEVNRQIGSIGGAMAGLRKALAPPSGPSPWRQFLGSALGAAASKLGGVLPSGTSFQSYAAGQASSLIGQALKSAAGAAAGLVGGPTAQKFFSPQVAKNLGTQINNLQTWLGTSGFQQHLNNTIGSALGAAFGRRPGASPRFWYGAGPGGGFAGGTAAATGGTWGGTIGSAIGAIGKFGPVAGILIGATLSVAAAFKFLIKATGQFAEHTNINNRWLAAFNPNIARAFFRQDIASWQRGYGLAQATEKTVVGLADAVTEMRKSWYGFEVFQMNLNNRMAQVGAGINNQFGDAASKLGGVADRIFNAIDPGGNGGFGLGKGIGDAALMMLLGPVGAAALQFLPPAAQPPPFEAPVERDLFGRALRDRRGMPLGPFRLPGQGGRQQLAPRPF